MTIGQNLCINTLLLAQNMYRTPVRLQEYLLQPPGHNRNSTKRLPFRPPPNHAITDPRALHKIYKFAIGEVLHVQPLGRSSTKLPCESVVQYACVKDSGLRLRTVLHWSKGPTAKSLSAPPFRLIASCCSSRSIRDLVNDRDAGFTFFP